MKKLAIIGASTGQLPIVLKAKELNIETHCFGWDKNAVCKEYCDFFYPVSIYDYNEIVSICQLKGIDGVVSNASEKTALVTAIIAEKLQLTGTSPEVVRLAQDKLYVRNLTKDIPGLSSPNFFSKHSISEVEYPCVVKPVKGGGKRGVKFCNTKEELDSCIKYAKEVCDDIIIEQFIPGNEYSVETLSARGKHTIVQITEKVSTGSPHFVELEHHQPANLTDSLKERVFQVVNELLYKIGFSNGASHIELKVFDNNIYLIEINPRGGGDKISDTLVKLSTNCDFIKEIIKIALGEFKETKYEQKFCSGICFVNKQNAHLLDYFKGKDNSAIIEKHLEHEQLIDSKSNYDRNGYIIYQSHQKITL